MKVLTDFVTWCENHEVTAVLLYLGAQFISLFAPLLVTLLGNRFANPGAAWEMRRGIFHELTAQVSMQINLNLLRTWLQRQNG